MRRAAIPRIVLALLLAVASLPIIGAARSTQAAAAACATAGQVPVTTVYLPNITKALGGPSGWVTPFYIQNTGVVQTTVEVTFYGFSDGAQVACRRTTGVAPGTTLADDPNADADLPADTQFSVVVKSFDAPVVAMVNQVQGSGASQQALSYSGFTSGGTTVYLPNVTRRFFGWDVPFIIQNLGSVATAATAAFTSSPSGSCTTPHAYAKTLAIDPGKSKVVDPDFEAASTGAPGSGLVDGCQYSVVVTSPQPIAVVANAHNDVGAPSAYSHDGIATGATTVYAPYALRTTSLFSNIVTQNLGSAAVTATLTFTPIGGGAAQVFTLAGIPAGGSRPFDVRYTSGDTAQPLCPAVAATGCLASGEYSLVITAPSAVAAVVLPVSGATAAGYVASPAPMPRSLVPVAFRAVGGAAGWTSTVYLQSTTATSATARWFSLATGDVALVQPLTLVPGATIRIDPRTVAGLADNAQYSLTIDANGPAAAVVFEQGGSGGDASMIFEAFGTAAQPATGQPGSMRIGPATATVATGATQQFAVTFRDQFGAAMSPVAPLVASLAPSTLGTLALTATSVGFTAGGFAGSGTLTAASGGLSATASITVTVPSSATVGGISFTVSTSGAADVYTETSISATDRSTVVAQVDLDVAAVQTDFARTYVRRPALYVFANTSSYTTGLQTIFGATASEALQLGQSSNGLYDSQRQAIAADWQKIGPIRPLATLRHELTHMIEHQVVTSGAMPAWFDEGNARLEDLTVPGGLYRVMQNRYGAASMAATNTLFTLADLTSNATWNSRTGAALSYQYYAASQAVQLLKNDLGMAGVLRMLELMGQGQTVEAAYAAVAGQPFSSFSTAYPVRIRALAPAYPAIATAPDTQEGGGLAIFLYGFPPGSSVTIIVSGTRSSAPTTVSVNAFGTYSTYLGGQWPIGSYGIQANWSGGIVTTQATKTSSLFDASIALDPGVPLDLELPADTHAGAVD